MAVIVEFYAGYKGEESPRRVSIAGRSLAVETVLGRERGVDIQTGLLRETFVCRLENDDVVRLERMGEGAWTVTPAPGGETNGRP